MDIKNEMLWRIYGVTFVIIAFALVVFGRVIQIQVVEGDELRSSADSLVKYIEVKAERGNIFAEDESLLATSVPFFEVRMDPLADGLTEEVFNKYVDTLAWYIGKYIHLDKTQTDIANQLRAARIAKNRYFLIKKNLKHQEVALIKKFPLFNMSPHHGGLIVHQMNKRHRPFRMLAHRTVGYVRDDANPVGLEGAFDDVLSGEEGMIPMQYIGNGFYKPINNLTKIDPKRGHDIKTTIDVNIQDVAGNALLKALKKHDAHHGCAVVIEVKTGAIKAIANIGKNRNGNYWETYNYAVGESTEPGSTFKLATIMALLEDGLVDLNDSIDLEQGQTQFYEETMKDASFHGLDSTSVQRAFEISSNVGIAKLVNYNYSKKPKQFIKRLKQFHLDKKTDIEIEGEGRPYIKEEDDNSWSGTTLPWMAHGYEVQLTPLQLLTFYNAVANKGRMMKPYLVSEIIDYGKVYEKYTPVVLKKSIATQETIRKAQHLLESVVENGTAESIKSEDYKIAGKTGTAQINYRRLRPQSRMQYQASFVGYFPADDPVYSCIVVINDPKVNGYYGSQVAAPVFKEISDKCYASKIELHPPMNIVEKPTWTQKRLPDYNIGNKEEIKQVLAYLDLEFEDEDINSGWTVMRAEDDKLALMPRSESDEGITPNVGGMGLRDAIFALESAGLKVNVRGSGKVSGQSIEPYTKVSKGKTITILLK